MRLVSYDTIQFTSDFLFFYFLPGFYEYLFRTVL